MIRQTQINYSRRRAWVDQKIRPNLVNKWKLRFWISLTLSGRSSYCKEETDTSEFINGGAWICTTNGAWIWMLVQCSWTYGYFCVEYRCRKTRGTHHIMLRAQQYSQCPCMPTLSWSSERCLLELNFKNDSAGTSHVPVVPKNGKMWNYRVN